MCSWWNLSSWSAIKSHFYHKGTVNAAYSDMMRTAWASLETNVTAEHQRNWKGLKQQFIIHGMSSFFRSLSDVLLSFFTMTTIHCKSSKTENTFVVCRTMKHVLHRVIHHLGTLRDFLYFSHDQAYSWSVFFVFFYHFDCQASYFQDGLFI